MTQTDPSVSLSVISAPEDTLPSPERARELAHEEAMLTGGAERYHRKVLKSKEKGREDETDYGQHLVKVLLGPLETEIQKYLEDAKTKVGRRAAASVLMAGVSPALLAYLTLRRVMTSLHQNRAVQSVANDIGGDIEDELRFGSLKDNYREDFDATQKYIEGSSFKERHHKRAVFRHASKVHDLAFRPWSTKERVRVGMAMIDHLLTVAGDMFVIARGKKSGKRSDPYKLTPTPELLAWVLQTVSRNALIRPKYQPTIEPPVPWLGLKGGGYYHSRMKKPLVRGVKSKAWFRELASRDLGIVYEAVNALQAVPWTIDTYILETAEACLEAGIEVKGLPSKDLADYPPRPEGFKPDAKRNERWMFVHPEAKTAWKKKARRIFHSNRQRVSRVMLSASIISTARGLAAHPSIYFPLQLDFRGRLYPVPPGLNPQGSDLAKGMLRFAKGKALGQGGVKWLKIHLANTWGFDKVSLEDRMKWADENSAWIVRCAADPIAHREWIGADKPWRFLQAAAEWVGYLTDGEAFESSLNIDIDGSNNGVQHLAALSRDADAGARVNLTPAEKPADIYQDVADRLVAILKDEVGGKSAVPPSKPNPKGRTLNDTLKMTDAQLAQAWLDYGITRKYTTKRPTMVQPYGGTRSSATEYIEQGLLEQAEEGKKGPWGEKTGAASAWLTPRLWLAMEQIITGPRKVMDWLKQIAQVAGGLGIPLTWEVPSGFLVQQAYPNVSRFRLKTKLGDSIVRLTLVILEETGLDSRRQRQATAPNWIHSLDAAALMKTIVACHNRGLQMSAVHDSYGTHASDMDILAEETRRQFVALYDGRNMLEDFRAQITYLLPEGHKPLPDPPALGTLDLNGVMASRFFFA